MSTIFEALNKELADLVDTVNQGVVQVRNRRGGAGAGTVWHAQGLVLTNAHVVRSESPIVVLADGRELPAKEIARDDTNDLAALSIKADNLTVIEPGDSRSVRPGQFVTSIGHPWGILGSASAGVIIGLEQQRDERGLITREWISVSHQLRPGNSGGPLIDEHGRLIGINSMMHGPSVGVAVPVHVAKGFLKQRLAA